MDASIFFIKFAALEMTEGTEKNADTANQSIGRECKGVLEGHTDINVQFEIMMGKRGDENKHLANEQIPPNLKMK
jgi:hypothetical protein